MRLIGLFIWIAVGAIILWFFALNLNQYVTINMFTRVFENVNLVTVIFISIFVGVILGALILSAQIVKAKAEVAGIKRQNKKLLKELDSLRTLSTEPMSEAGSALAPSENE